MKKAFTLVELLAVIILLGLLGLIIYPTVNGVINTNKQKLHDKQIEELKRYANTYAAYNTSKLKTRYGSKNIVTFTDLYEAGIIQNDKVVDPSNDEELNGCLILMWNNSRNQFDIEYTENCDKYGSISGNIQGIDTRPDSSSYNTASPILANVSLMQGTEILYETTTDANGDYSFSGVETGNYILLVSQPYKTKYGREVSIDGNITKDMTVTLYLGDYDNNDVTNYIDVAEILNCWASGSSKAGCKDFDYYDVDGDGAAIVYDSTYLRNHPKSSDIILEGTFSLTGKITTDKALPETVVLAHNTNSYEATVASDGTYKFENIPKGGYTLKVTNTYYLPYNKFYLITDDTNINIHMYYGDLDSNNYINDADIERIERDIDRMNSGSYTYEQLSRSDINGDGVIDQRDIKMLQSTINKINN